MFYSKKQEVVANSKSDKSKTVEDFLAYNIAQPCD